MIPKLDLKATVEAATGDRGIEAMAQLVPVAIAALFERLPLPDFDHVAAAQFGPCARIEIVVECTSTRDGLLMMFSVEHPKAINQLHAVVQSTYFLALADFEHARIDARSESAANWLKLMTGHMLDYLVEQFGCWVKDGRGGAPATWCAIMPTPAAGK